LPDKNITNVAQLLKESKACLFVFHNLLIMCLFVNASEAVQKLFLALIDSD